MGKQMDQSVTVIGLGKLGAPLAACLAFKGLRVLAVDADPLKVEAVNRGAAPVYEPGLESMIQASRDRLTATRNIAEAVAAAQITFIVVSTPSEPGGGFSLRYVLPVCEAVGRAVAAKSEFHLVVLTSTVMPGSTGSEVKASLERASGKRCGCDFGLCYGPEFIALGSVIHDFLNPDFILIGESDPRSGDILAEIYRKVCENSPRIARMNLVNAEITKLAVNTFITTKISFANMVARICEKLPHASVDTVTAALGLDSRIGGKYLKGAVSFGGPCFPRDNLAFTALARQLGAPSDIAETTAQFNRAQLEWLEETVRRYALTDGCTGILGLAYKPHTDVVEESVGLHLARNLIARRMKVTAYDPAANRNAALALGTGVKFAGTARECIEQSDAVVVTTPWPEFRDIPAKDWGRAASPRVVIDCWRVLEHLKADRDILYVPLGLGAVEPGRLEKAMVSSTA